MSQKKLIKITGYIYPKHQTRWLAEHNLGYTWSRKGTLNVLVDDYLKNFGAREIKKPTRKCEPDFNAIKEINGKKANKVQRAAN